MEQRYLSQSYLLYLLSFVFSRNPEQTIASLILTQIDFPVYILWDIFLDNVTTSLPFIMTPVAVNMDKTKRWLERQVMPSLLMIKEIEKQTGANYLEEIDRHTRLTEKQELKIKQMTTDSFLIPRRSHALTHRLFR